MGEEFQYAIVPIPDLYGEKTIWHEFIYQLYTSGAGSKKEVIEEMDIFDYLDFISFKRRESYSEYLAYKNQSKR